MKKYLALDVGDVRIGVAKSDILGMLASPVETIDRRKTKAVKRIVELCREVNTTSIVVGIPKSLDGTEKRQAEKVREFVVKLEKEIEDLEVIEVDERFSTVMADNILNDLNKKGAIEKRKVVDKMAAAIILQTFLDSQKRNFN
ncbi:Holliday junction resolvase RuvX [Fusobacterium sp.]|uniref:Holliday junction resolvase RuvX n=1 Tax=Fusobacterium sp. TaxID=68766 RepID=UPI0025BC99B1|nr:Holliday junction resolvase RuvX [Fusobacterium sp.]MCI7223365.1 Holliday junction resolvase RuvX [Fusobacterium sp.]